MLVSDVLTAVSYRLGLDGTPDGTEQSRWISHCADAQRSILRKNLYWFTQDTKGISTITGRNRYSLDTTFRQMVSVTLNGLELDPLTEHESAVRNINGFPYRPNSTVFSSVYFLYDDEINIPYGSITSPTTYSVSSISRVLSTVTVTTTLDHGLVADNFVTIGGAVQTEYNASHRVYTTPSSTSFTFIIATLPTTPATGTITATAQNLVYRFYSVPTPPTLLTQTLIIPDLFFEGFVSYIKARVDIQDSERGSASDGLDEFNQIIEDMNVEHNKRMLANVHLMTY